MHIGLNLIYLIPGETGGTEIVARELIPELVNASPHVKFTAFINRETSSMLESLKWLANMSTVTLPIHARQRVQWFLGEQVLLPRFAARAGIDLLHSLANTGPSLGSFKRVVTIHDLHFKLVPEAHTPLMRLGMAVAVPLAARRSDRVIAPSKSTANEIHALLRINRSKISTVVQGAGTSVRATPLPERELRKRYGLQHRQIVLCVASKRRHKNLAALVSALALISPERRPVLVCPGYSTPYERELLDLADRLGVLKNVKMLSWITSEELEGLYEAAACLACPSLHEGFGLPVLEAMVRGVPVACSSRGALAEVAGDAAITFDPTQPNSIAAGIELLLSDPIKRAELREMGIKRASGYSWQVAAKEIMAVYESVLRERASADS